MKCCRLRHMLGAVIGIAVVVTYWVIATGMSELFLVSSTDEEEPGKPVWVPLKQSILPQLRSTAQFSAKAQTRYLVPVARFGPNNQFGDLLQAMTLAMELRRDMIAPPILKHQDDRSSPGDYASPLHAYWNTTGLERGIGKRRLRVVPLSDERRLAFESAHVAVVGCQSRHFSWATHKSQGPKVPIRIFALGPMMVHGVTCFPANLGAAEGAERGSAGVADAFRRHGVDQFPIIFVSWEHNFYPDVGEQTMEALRLIRFSNVVETATNAFLASRSLLDGTGRVRPFVGAHVRRGDFARFCRKYRKHAWVTRRKTCPFGPGRIPLNMTTCFPPPYLIGREMYAVRRAANSDPAASPCDAEDALIATDEDVANATFWAELRHAVLDPGEPGGQGIPMRRMHTFWGGDALREGGSARPAPWNGAATEEWMTRQQLSGTMQSVIEQAAMVQSCGFVANPVSSWSRLVLAYRRAWGSGNMCRFFGQ